MNCFVNDQSVIDKLIIYQKLLVFIYIHKLNNNRYFLQNRYSFILSSSSRFPNDLSFSSSSSLPYSSKPFIPLLFNPSVFLYLFDSPLFLYFSYYSFIFLGLKNIVWRQWCNHDILISNADNAYQSDISFIFKILFKLYWNFGTLYNTLLIYPSRSWDFLFESLIKLLWAFLYLLKINRSSSFSSTVSILYKITSLQKIF